MTYKLKISKPGYNAITETNNDNLIFSSDYGTLKYFISGSITLTVNFSDYYDTYTYSGWPYTYYRHEKIGVVYHNLGYYPFFIAYYSDISTGKNYLLPFEFDDVNYFEEIYSYVDTSKIYFHILMDNLFNSGTKNFTFYYKIFKNNTGL